MSSAPSPSSPAPSGPAAQAAARPSPTWAFTARPTTCCPSRWASNCGTNGCRRTGAHPRTPPTRAPASKTTSRPPTAAPRRPSPGSATAAATCPTRPAPTGSSLLRARRGISLTLLLGMAVVATLARLSQPTRAPSHRTQAPTARRSGRSVVVRGGVGRRAVRVAAPAALQTSGTRSAFKGGIVGGWVEVSCA